MGGGTGLEATGPPLNCGVFSTGKLIDLNHMSSVDQKKMLNRFIACIGANSSMDIDGLYFKPITIFNWHTGEYTGLMAATLLGFNDLARTLIHYGANINGVGIYGETPLHYAAAAGQVSTVRLLLERGADVTIRRTTAYNRWTALEAASYRGRTNVVALLQSWGR